MKSLEKVDTEALLAELARRQAETGERLDEMERDAEVKGDALKHRQMEAWLERMSQQETDGAKPCPKCGRATPIKARSRPRKLRALRGVFSYTRHYHFCEHCRAGFYPLDEKVDAPQQGEATELLQERALDFAVNAPFEEASERLSMHYGVEVSTHALRCMVKRLPLPEFEPMQQLEEQERVTVQVDGSMVPMRAGWSESKLGVVLSQAHYSKGTTEHRGQVTEARYVATMGGVEDFAGHLSKVLPARRGVKARQEGQKGPEVVWVCDGAPWVWGLQRELCPQAVTVLDWCHAVSHGVQCGKEVLDEDPGLCAMWEARLKHLLWEGQVETLLKELAECALLAKSKQASESLRKLQGYYKNNKRRMNYREHREAGRLIGSGVVESAHKHVLQTRMKRAGQHWSEAGAEKMARLRAVYQTVGAAGFYQAVSQVAA